jgi:hypothetical protein
MAERREQRHSEQIDLHVGDSDLKKGAIEGAPDGQGNRNAPALDDQGLPNDEVAIAEDVLGANEDQTTG